MQYTRYGFLTFLIFLLLLSCASSPSSETEGKGRRPEWISQHPANQLFYIGIGGSQTGNQANDQQIARSRALSELSSEIFASVKSTLDITATDSSETGDSYQVEQNIIQKVQQDLEAIETVETWYSEVDGFWYYLRLSRADWEAIQERRAQELIQRIGEMFSAPFRDTLSELKTIDRAYTEYRNNYTGRKVLMDLFGERGSIDTLLVVRAEELLKGLTLPDLPFPSETPQMRQVLFSGKITSSQERNAGALQLDLTRGDQLLGQIPANPDGSIDWTYSVEEKPGEVNFTLKMSSPFANTDLNAHLEYALPRISKSVLITPLLVRLSVVNPVETDQGIYQRSFDIMNRLSPFTLTTGESDKQIKIEFSYREAPPNDYGIVISYGRSFIILVAEEGEKTVWQSPEVKTGGLTVDQARAKAADKLLEEMQSDPELGLILNEMSF
jgi:hypothetical protein